MKEGRFEEEVLMAEAEMNEAIVDEDVQNAAGETLQAEDYEIGSQVGNDEENDNNNLDENMMGEAEENDLKEGNYFDGAENGAKSVFTMKTKQSRNNTINSKYSKLSKT